MPRSRSYTGKRSRQTHCSSRPPCSRGSSKYKMRLSRRHCCRKNWKARVGPSYYNKNKWVKFLRSHKGHGDSRAQLKRMYRSRH